MIRSLHLHPASLLLLGFITGMVSATWMQDPVASAGHLAMAAALAWLIRRDWKIVPALILLGLAAGLCNAERAARSSAAASEVIRSLPQARFVRIAAPVDRDWNSSRDGARTVVDRFDVEIDGRLMSIPYPLSIYAPASVSPIGLDDELRIEGFARISRSGHFYASVKSPRLIELSRTRSSLHPRRWNREMRSRLEEHAIRNPEHARAAALIRAVALGDGSALSDDMEDSYREGGTYHLLVFSGMQIAVAAAMLNLLLRLTGLRKGADVALLLLAAIAPPFAGNEPSVARASTMIFVYAGSRLIGRPTPVANLLFVSALVRLLMAPDELGTPGFLLTYAASFGLLIVGRTLASLTSRPFAAAAAFGFGAELCTQPLTLLLFRHYVAGGFAITLALSPLLSAIFVLAVPIDLALRHQPDLGWLLIELVADVDRLAVAVNAISAGLRLSGYAPAPPAILVIAAFLTAWLVYLSPIRARHKAASMILCLLLVPVGVGVRLAHLSSPPLSIEFLDVGQGDSALVRGPTTMLIDGGGSSTDPEFGRRKLLPLLADRGIRRIDVVAMSHPDEDHCGGLVPVLAGLPVEELWISPRHIEAPCTRKLLQVLRDTRVRFLRDGDVIRSGPVRTTVTIPRLRYKESAVNNSSVLLNLDLAGTSVILTGDIGSVAERDLAEEAADRLRASILKVPHHGSRSSTSEALLRVTDPRIAVISCAADNLYGHPAGEVLERLDRRRIHTLRTDLQGSIRLVPDGAGIAFTSPVADAAGLRLTLSRANP